MKMFKIEIHSTNLCLILLFVASLIKANIYQRKDLVFVIDSSKSIKQDVYETSIEFISSLVDYMSISPGTTRVALITFSSKAKLEFNFEQCVNRECVQRKFASIFKRARRGRTNIDGALHEVIYLFENFKGFAKDQEIYLISDGKWNDGKNPAEGIKKLNKRGVKLRILDVGRNADKSAFDFIISAPCKDCYHGLPKNDKDQKRLIKKLTQKEKPVTACKGRGFVLDECNRECDCIDGEMKNCFRIRKEFTTLSNEEKKRYLQAYYKITTKEPLKTRFIPFITKHFKWFWKGIHNRPQFHPWHRWYIYAFENLMREADCRLTVPFWDWSFWSFDAWKVGLHIWRDDEYGFGGNGIKSDEYCVETGPFNASTWSHPAPEDTYHVLHTVADLFGECDRDQKVREHSKRCVRRSFNHVPANLAHVLQTISLPCESFFEFDKRVRVHYHNDIHNEIGGDMCTGYAANAPEFFLHHAFLDNIWYRWQEKSLVCKQAYYGKSPRNLLDSPFTSNDFIDSSDQGEYVKVKYDDFLKRVLRSGDYIGTPQNADSPKHICENLEASTKNETGPAFLKLKEDMMQETEEERNIFYE